MDTSGQNHREVVIITLCIFVSQVIGGILPITASPEFPLESTTASLTCSIALFTGGAEWIKHGSRLTQCQSGSCIPPNSARYKYSINATSITVTIGNLDIALDEGSWTCVHNAGADQGVYNFTVYKIPSTLAINGPASNALSDGVIVLLSVRTGCIHPSGPQHHTVIWQYVEAGSAAEKLFEMGITQNFISLGGCANAYEENLMLNLYLTNRMNMGTTTLYIIGIKMIFTMAGRNVSALLNVAYDVIPVYTVSAVSSSSNQFALGLGLGLGFPFVISIIIILILVKKRSKIPPTEQSETACPQHISRPPAVHTATLNKVESNTTSKQTNDKHRPLPPLATGVKDTPKIRLQPPPPQKSDIKDHIQQGISATIDNTPGLPSETPCPSKLPPLPQNNQWSRRKMMPQRSPKGKERRKRRKVR